jgi:hypothetical protein
MDLSVQYDGIVYLDASWAKGPSDAARTEHACAPQGDATLVGTVWSYDGIHTRVPDAEICTLDGVCTASAADGTYTLCVPSDADVPVTTRRDGHSTQVTLFTTRNEARYEDLLLYSEAETTSFYANAGMEHPSPPGTGSVYGMLYDVNTRFLEGASFRLDPDVGVGPVYTGDDYVFDMSRTTTGAVALFLLGEVDAGWYDVVIEHPAVSRCWLVTGDYRSSDGTLRIPVVEGFETYFEAWCIP